jgi:hypothetical protein
MRQGELALESTWITADPWWRLACTMLGIISIDTLLVFRASVSSNNEYKRMGTYEFVSRLTYLMINNERPGFEQTPRAARTATRPRAEEAEESALPVHLRHNARSYGKKNEQPDFDLAMCKGDAASAYKQRCYVCARDKTAFPYGVKTSFYCGHEHCGRAVPLCRDGTGVHSRRCFEVHISECAQRSLSLGTASSSSAGPAAMPGATLFCNCTRNCKYYQSPGALALLKYWDQTYGVLFIPSYGK